jgi:hypothetical protein
MCGRECGGDAMGGCGRGGLSYCFGKTGDTGDKRPNAAWRLGSRRPRFFAQDRGHAGDTGDNLVEKVEQGLEVH